MQLALPCSHIFHVVLTVLTLLPCRRPYWFYESVLQLQGLALVMVEVFGRTLRSHFHQGLLIQVRLLGRDCDRLKGETTVCHCLQTLLS